MGCAKVVNKKPKISNNSLVVLLGLAIVVSIAGTWATLTIVDQITGAATATGTTTVNVKSVVSCSATDNTIVFGQMQRSGSNNSGNKSDYHVVSNAGNVDINVSAYASVNLWATQAAASSYWRIGCNNTNTSGSTCSDWANLAASSARTLLTDNLSVADATDDMMVKVEVTVPTDETTGNKSGTITYECIAVVS